MLINSFWKNLKFNYPMSQCNLLTINLFLSLDEVKSLTKQMIHHKLVTKQTKPEGALVEKVIREFLKHHFKDCKEQFIIINNR